MTDALREAAQAVLTRWDSPQWEWAKHGPTADLMAALRAALAQPPAAQPESAQPVPATGAQPPAVEALAHRIAWRYKKSSDPHHSDTYTFNRSTLLQFADALRAASIDAGEPPTSQAGSSPC